MTTKRILSSLLLMLALCSAAMAQQRLDITLTDKSVLSCDLDKISYMEIVEGAPTGTLDGVWYLGWKALNNGSGTRTHYNGTEVLVFTAGPKMKWIKNASELVYDLEYAGPAGGPTWATEIYGYKGGKQVEHFEMLEVEGEIDGCGLNDKDLTPEEGRAYVSKLSDAQPLNQNWHDIDEN